MINVYEMIMVWKRTQIFTADYNERIKVHKPKQPAANINSKNVSAFLCTAGSETMELFAIGQGDKSKNGLKTTLLDILISVEVGHGLFNISPVKSWR